MPGGQAARYALLQVNILFLVEKRQSSGKIGSKDGHVNWRKLLKTKTLHYFGGNNPREKSGLNCRCVELWQQRILYLLLALLT